MEIEVTLARLSHVAGGDETRAIRAEKLAALIRDCGPYRWVGLYEIDHNQGLVRNLAWSGPAAPAHPVFPMTQGLTGAAIAGKLTVNVGDVASDPRYLTALDTTRSEIIIPILDAASGVVAGTLDVESEHPNAFRQEVQAFLEQCAAAMSALLLARKSASDEAVRK